MNTSEILDKFGLTSKVLFIFRHGTKTADNHITPECLAKIEAEGIEGADIKINAIHEGSHFIRTTETVNALEKWLVANGGMIEKHLPKDDRLGNPDIFSFYTAEVMGKIKAVGYTYYEGLENFGYSVLGNWENDIVVMVSDLFNVLQPGDVCAVPCHTPTVEVIFNLFIDRIRDYKMSVKELEGIFLVQTNNGHIYAVR